MNFYIKTNVIYSVNRYNDGRQLLHADECVLMDGYVNRFLELFVNDAWPGWSTYLERTG